MPRAENQPLGQRDRRELVHNETEEQPRLRFGREPGKLLALALGEVARASAALAQQLHDAVPFAGVELLKVLVREQHDLGRVDHRGGGDPPQTGDPLGGVDDGAGREVHRDEATLPRGGNTEPLQSGAE